MSLSTLASNSIEASLRYVPTFGWLLLLPYSSLDMNKMIEYLSITSMFLSLTNIGFDRALLHISQVRRISNQHLLTLQGLRTGCIVILTIAYSVFLGLIEEVELDFELILAIALVSSHSLEVGDWYLRAIGQEKHLLRIKTWIIGSLTFPLLVFAWLNAWQAFHITYVMLVFMFGTAPYLLHLRGKNETTPELDHDSISFSSLFLQLIQLGKNFFLSGVVNLSLRRLSPLLFVRSGQDSALTYAFFMLMRILDAMTPMFVALTNYLYKRWRNLDAKPLIRDYFKVQTILGSFLMLLYLGYALAVNSVWPENTLVLHCFFWIFVLVVLLNQRNALMLNMNKTHLLPLLNVISLLPLPLLLLFGPFTREMQNGSMLYVSFLLATFLLTNLIVLKNLMKHKHQ